MAESLRFRRWLFCLTCMSAVLLAALVLSAPCLDDNKAEAVGWGRIVGLFAHDATLRRTSLASAAGLIATACVFFRPAAPDRPSAPQSQEQTTTRRPGSDVAGA